MERWKIVITDGLNGDGQAILRPAAHVDDCTDISADDLMKIIGEYDAMIVRGRTKVTAAVFNTGRKLRVVGRAGVGVDNIDLVAAKAQNVRVVNAPQSTSLAVAELTLGHLLAVARAVPRGDYNMKKGLWIKKQLEGVELFGKTLGIIGIGNIGSAVAQRAAAFGMYVLAYDIFKSAEEVALRNARMVPLDELYSTSDYVSLHVPLTDKTRGMIDADAIAKMKPGVRIISTARGGVINETALLDALNSGHVAAAGLDVFAQEPPGLTDLVTHPNVVATPHIGAQTEEAQGRASVDIAREVLAALRGETLRWKVA